MTHFTFSELLHSDRAVRDRIPNIANHQQEGNLLDLVVNVLDPLRDGIGQPVYVSSGFRCVLLNNKVGGEKQSQHTLGQAADIYGKGDRATRLLGEYIYDNLVYDQLIFEDVDAAGNPKWIHVSYRQGNNRCQCLVKYRGKSGYNPYKPHSL